MSGASTLAPPPGPGGGPKASAARDPLRYTFEDARAQQLRDGRAMSTEEIVAWFEEMIEIWAACSPEADEKKVVSRGPADPRIDATIEAATALAESTCERCGSGGRRA